MISELFDEETIPIDMIASVTGLSAEKIGDLAEEYKKSLS